MLQFNEDNKKKDSHVSYDTVSEAVRDLQKMGYTTDFAVHGKADCLICRKTDLQLAPEDFEIDAFFRFEGDSDPGDEMIIMAISSERYKIKGLVVNAFGLYADPEISNLTSRLLLKKKK